MFKSPSSRRKKAPTEMTINLVPMLDTLVTLIAFLMFSMAFLSFVSIETPVPMASSEQNERIKEKPLQLTLVLDPDYMELWSPFGKVPTKRIPNTPDGQPDIVTLHDSLVHIKKQFPKEPQIVFVPHPRASYDVMIAVIDNVRFLTKTDDPIYIENPTTKISEPIKELFPEIVFGNLLGDR